MTNRSGGQPAVAFATVEDLPWDARTRPDAEHAASRIAAHRAIRALVGDRGTIEVRRRIGRAPLAHVIDGSVPRRRVALSLSHRDGRAAAVASVAATGQVGIDLENVETIDPARERFFLTERERESVGSLTAAVLWAMKEAAWKALELDSSVGFHELELEIDANGTVRGVWCCGIRRAAAVSLTSPWPGYVLAVAHLRFGQ